MKLRLWGLILFILLSAHASGQINQLVYRTNYRIDTAKVRQLLVEVDNISFFVDNEYKGPYVKGYSLPGLWVQPKLIYYPLSNLKVEAGVHFLFYHGADKYPSVAYQDIAEWKGEHYQKGVHVLPYFRAQLALGERFNLVFGNLYGAANHQLIEPLYHPELNLSCDPEMGLQLLYASPRFNMDIWINWQSFIFRDDIHKEAFTVGLSSRVKVNDPEESSFHLSIPIQVLAQHRGGEIDTIYTNSVQTLINGAVGVRGTWRTHQPWLQKVEAEVDGFFSYQQAGIVWPFESGYGLYARVVAEAKGVRAKLGYSWCDQFVSLYGSPFFGAVSMSEQGTTFDRPHLLTYGLEYSRPFGNGFAFGAEIKLYHALSPWVTTVGGDRYQAGRDLSFSVGAYLRINPSFLLKQF